jgi:hypothetical protein
VHSSGIDAGLSQHVFATFMRDGRIVQLPARQKKRMVLLVWLADHFRPGQRYTEAQVSELLSRYYDDYATLRRLLVDHELMQRKGGLYWRAGTMPFPD